MKGIAAMALASGLTAAPVLAAGQSAASNAPVRLSDGELDQVSAGGTLPLNLGSLVQSLGQDLGLSVDLSAGAVNLSTGVHRDPGTLTPLLQGLGGLTFARLHPVPGVLQP
ncbi:MAG TPA: hypothetical protein VI356_13980 [Myxococcales bacterium]